MAGTHPAIFFFAAFVPPAARNETGITDRNFLLAAAVAARTSFGSSV
jgi:hypothetical protein